jgi:putative polyhydroxyalkanoate system protein
MSNIDIRHPHSRPDAEARAAVERVAQKIEERFDIRYAWEGDQLHFERSGVDGHIALEPGQIHVTARLGFLLAMMRGSIEDEIRRYLEREFT